MTDDDSSQKYYGKEGQCTCKSCRKALDTVDWLICGYAEIRATKNVLFEVNVDQYLTLFQTNSARACPDYSNESTI
jgi:hypothetical protein